VGTSEQELPKLLLACLATKLWAGTRTPETFAPARLAEKVSAATLRQVAHPVTKHAVPQMDAPKACPAIVLSQPPPAAWPPAALERETLQPGCQGRQHGVCRARLLLRIADMEMLSEFSQVANFGHRAGCLHFFQKPMPAAKDASLLDS